MAKGSKSIPSPQAGPSTPTSKPQLYTSFLPIPLLLPTPIPIPSSSSSRPVNQVTHHIYVRPHRLKTSKPGSLLGDAEEPINTRTTFVANLPVDMTERGLRLVFGRWGLLESVALGGGNKDGNALENAVQGLPADSEADSEASGSAVDDDEIDPAPAQPTSEPHFLGTAQPSLPRSKRPRRKPQLPPSVPETPPLPPLDARESPFGPSGARSAHITYLDPISVSRAMSYAGGPIKIPKYGDDPANPTGLDYYRRLHTSLRPGLASVKEHADGAMARHDHLHSLLLSSRAKKQGAGALVDEDGFTVVVRSGRYGRTGGSGASGVGVARKAPVPEEGKKKKGIGGGELADFYRFQKVDRKREGQRLHASSCERKLMARFRARGSAQEVSRGQRTCRGDEEGPAIQAVLSCDAMYLSIGF